MIDWSTLELARPWPALVAACALAVLAAIWLRRGGAAFPDTGLLEAARGRFSLPDRLVPPGGLLILLILGVAMSGPSVVRQDLVEGRARDFVILVDTSRSMRHDTSVRRETANLHFERRIGAFQEAVASPDTMPYVGRFELARESLYRFLAQRDADDRVALLYFNDNVFPVSAMTGDTAFLTEQLAAMDDYVNWGTNVADALASAMNLVERYPGGNRRSVILLTDAETRFSESLDTQFARLGDSGLAFYMLWITADTADPASEDARTFLDLAGSAGSVYTIREPDAANLGEALEDIALNESYQYEEIRRRAIDLSAPLLEAARILLLTWLLAVSTVCHPVATRQIFGGIPQ